MYFLIREIQSAVSGYDNIVIYGAGDYACMIYPKLCEIGLRDRISAFVVTKRTQENEEIDNIPVFQMNEMRIEKSTTLILVCVSEFYRKEIVDSLSMQEYKNILCIVDFLRDERGTRERFAQIDKKTISLYVADWYVYSNCNKISEYDEFVNEFTANFSKKREINENTIIFIMGSMNIRTIKIIKALIKLGWYIEVLAYGNFVNGLAHSELDEYDVLIEYCDCVEELLFKLVQKSPLLYFFDPLWGDCSWAEILISWKKCFRPIVLALYDVLNDGYIFKEEEKWRYSSERYALENADGVVWRYFSKEYLEQKKGFHYKGISIHFMDYCGGYLVKERQDNYSDSVVRLCFVSGDPEFYLDDSHNKKGYRYDATISEILQKIGNREDCILHLYAGNDKKSNVIKCRELEEKYKNFKVFWKLEHDKMISVISDYDYGCFLCMDGIRIPEDEPLKNWKDNEKEVKLRYTGHTCITSMANRFFDYLDAHLPIIAQIPEMLCEFLGQYGVILDMSVQTLDIEYLKKHKTFYKQKAVEAKKKLLIDENIDRLSRFLICVGKNGENI